MGNLPHTPNDLLRFLNMRQISAQLIADLGDTPTVPAAAAALGVESDQIIKTLLFLVEKPGEPESAAQPVVVISHGERRVDKKRLADHFGVGAKRVKLASAELVLDLIGYPAGGVPPLGHKTQLPIIMDASVLTAGERFGGIVYGGGGDDRTMLKLTLADLCAEIQPTVVAVS